MSVGLRKSTRSRRMAARILMSLLVVGAIAGGVGWRYWTHWSPSRTDYPTQGVSVSFAQGDIDWGILRAQGADFVYIGVATGGGQRDPRFAANWSGARRAGLRFGAEVAFDPCTPASEQATLFITTVPRDNAALPPAIRPDDRANCTPAPTRDHVLSELNTLIVLIESHSGKPALLHLSKAFETHYDIARSINRTLWLDGNGLPPGFAGRPWVMWTANDARRIEGVSAPVEWNVVAK